MTQVTPAANERLSRNLQNCASQTPLSLHDGKRYTALKSLKKRPVPRGRLSADPAGSCRARTWQVQPGGSAAATQRGRKDAHLDSQARLLRDGGGFRVEPPQPSCPSLRVTGTNQGPDAMAGWVKGRHRWLTMDTNSPMGLSLRTRKRASAATRPAPNATTGGCRVQPATGLAIRFVIGQTLAGALA